MDKYRKNINAFKSPGCAYCLLHFFLIIFNIYIEAYLRNFIITNQRVYEADIIFYMDHVAVNILSGN